MAKKMRKKPRKAPGLLGHVTAPRYYDPPGPAPRETLAYLSPFEKRALLGMTDGRSSRGPRGLPSFADDSASSLGVSRGDAYGTKGSGSDPGPNGGSISRSSGGGSPSNAGGGGSPSGNGGSLGGGALNSMRDGQLAANYGMSFNPGSPGYGSTLPGSFGYPASGPSQFSKDNAAQMAAMAAERQALQGFLGPAFPSVPTSGFPAAPSAINPSRGVTVPSSPPSAFAGAFPSDPRLGIDPKGISNLPGLSGPNQGLGPAPAQPGNYTDPTNRISGVYSAFNAMPGSAFSNTDYTGLSVNPTLGAMNLPSALNPSQGTTVAAADAADADYGRMLSSAVNNDLAAAMAVMKRNPVVQERAFDTSGIIGSVDLASLAGLAFSGFGPTVGSAPSMPNIAGTVKDQARAASIQGDRVQPGLSSPPSGINSGPTQPSGTTVNPSRGTTVPSGPPTAGPVPSGPPLGGWQNPPANETSPAMPAYDGPFTPDERQGTSFPSTPASPPIDAPRGGFAGDYSPSSPSLEGGGDAQPDQNIDMNKVLNDLDRLNNFARMNYERVQRAIGNRDPNGAFGGQFAGGGSGLNRGRRPIQPPTPPTMPSTEELNSIYTALQAAGATPDELAAVLAMMHR